MAAVRVSHPVEEKLRRCCDFAVGASQFLRHGLVSHSEHHFAVRGGRTMLLSPINVNGGNAISSGFEKSAGGNSVFGNAERTALLRSGNWDTIEGSGPPKNVRTCPKVRARVSESRLTT